MRDITITLTEEERLAIIRMVERVSFTDDLHKIAVEIKNKVEEAVNCNKALLEDAQKVADRITEEFPDVAIDSDVLDGWSELFNDYYGGKITHSELLENIVDDVGYGWDKDEQDRLWEIVDDEVR